MTEGRGPHLSCDCYLNAVLNSRWAISLVKVVQDDGHRYLCDIILSMFIDKILLILSTHLKEKRYLSKRVSQEMMRNMHGRHVSETEDKINSIDDF